MTRFAAAAGADVRLQFRNGFYAATAFVLGFWLLAARWLSGIDLAWVLPALVAGNLLMNTFYFVAGLVMLERAEGTLEAVGVTPLRAWEYLAAKAVTLVALATVENLAVVLLLHGTGFGLAALVLGVVAVSAVFFSAGIVAVARHGSVNEFLMPSVVYTGVLTIPLATYLVGWESWVMMLHPIEGGLLLMRAAFEPVEAWRLAAGALSAVAWAALLWRASVRAYGRMTRG